MSKTSINKCAYSGAEIEPDTNRDHYYGGRSADGVNNKVYAKTDEVTHKGGKPGKESSPPVLCLKKQDFFQAKLLSLLLYASFLLMLPAISLQVISVFEGNIIYSVLGTTAVLICLGIRFSVLYHISKFVNNNFHASKNFKLVIWGLAISMLMTAALTNIFIFSYENIGKELKMIVPAIAILSFISFIVFNILLYREIYSSIDNFVEEVYDPFDYENREVYTESSTLDEIIWDKLSIPFRIPAHLFRIFSEAELYTKEHGCV